MNVNVVYSDAEQVKQSLAVSVPPYYRTKDIQIVVGNALRLTPDKFELYVNDDMDTPLTDVTRTHAHSLTAVVTEPGHAPDVPVLGGARKKRHATLRPRSRSPKVKPKPKPKPRARSRSRSRSSSPKGRHAFREFTQAYFKGEKARGRNITYKQCLKEAAQLWHRNK